MGKITALVYMGISLIYILLNKSFSLWGNRVKEKVRYFVVFSCWWIGMLGTILCLVYGALGTTDLMYNVYTYESYESSDLGISYEEYIQKQKDLMNNAGFIVLLGSLVLATTSLNIHQRSLELKNRTMGDKD